MSELSESPLSLSARHLTMLRQMLSEYVPGAEVWAYGSRVLGTAHEGSDLDLVLRNPKNLDLDVDGWHELQTALQSSQIPILVDVHLWSRLPKEFKLNIERAYKVVSKGSHG